ncbi:MAG: hypothetical protein HW387_446 [Parachlamydiales bacterium]|nr:hypothetical protein [Parachlamydiales bacterium]
MALGSFVEAEVFNGNVTGNCLLIKEAIQDAKNNKYDISIHFDNLDSGSKIREVLGRGFKYKEIQILVYGCLEALETHLKHNGEDLVMDQWVFVVPENAEGTEKISQVYKKTRAFVGGAVSDDSCKEIYPIPTASLTWMDDSIKRSRKLCENGVATVADALELFSQRLNIPVVISIPVTGAKCRESEDRCDAHEINTVLQTIWEEILEEKRRSWIEFLHEVGIEKICNAETLSIQNKMDNAKFESVDLKNKIDEIENKMLKLKLNAAAAAPA